MQFDEPVDFGSDACLVGNDAQVEVQGNCLNSARSRSSRGPKAGVYLPVLAYIEALHAQATCVA